MASATRKKASFRVENPTKKPLKQIELGLPKNMPGFARYEFYANGKVKNKATGSEIKNAKENTGVDGFRLTNDKGVRAWVYPADIEKLFAPTVPVKASRYVKKVEGRKQYNRLTKAEIDSVLKSKEEGQKLAEKYNVHPSTISRLRNQLTRTASYFK
jgi:hypothetical protein